MNSKVAKYSEQAGVHHSLLPVPVVDVLPAAEPVRVPEPVSAPEPVHAAHEVDSDGADSDQESSDMVTVIGGRWYAVYWEPTSYWYIGEATHQTDTNMWVFSFLEQSSPSANGFKPVKDSEAGENHFVFLEVEAPAPASSTRTSLLKLTAADFRSVQQKFKDL